MCLARLELEFLQFSYFGKRQFLFHSSELVVSSIPFLQFTDAANLIFPCSHDVTVESCNQQPHLIVTDARDLPTPNERHKVLWLENQQLTLLVNLLCERIILLQA